MAKGHSVPMPSGVSTHPLSVARIFCILTKVKCAQSKTSMSGYVIFILKLKKKTRKVEVKGISQETVDPKTDL